VDIEYYYSHTNDMKIAISIPDPLFEEAEALAGRLSLSRSALYRRALEAYLRTFREDELIRRINEVCTDVDTSLPPEQERATAELWSHVEWEE